MNPFVGYILIFSHVLMKRFVGFSMFLWFILVNLLFLSAFSDAVSVSSTIITPFFE